MEFPPSSFWNETVTGIVVGGCGVIFACTAIVWPQIFRVKRRTHPGICAVVAVGLMFAAMMWIGMARRIRDAKMFWNTRVQDITCIEIFEAVEEVGPAWRRIERGNFSDVIATVDDPTEIGRAVAALEASRGVSRVHEHFEGGYMVRIRTTKGYDLYLAAAKRSSKGYAVPAVTPTLEPPLGGPSGISMGDYRSFDLLLWLDRTVRAVQTGTQPAERM